MSVNSTWVLIADLDEVTGRRWRLRREGIHAHPGETIRDVVAQTQSGLVVRVAVAYCYAVHFIPSPETECEVTSAVWVLAVG